jgi:hypothetical protein
MNSLINVFYTWPIVKSLGSPSNDDEHVDRLNHRVTVGLILIGVFITSTTSFVSHRMSCWVPAELKHSSYNKYIESYCWISNTYYIDSNGTLPKSDDDRQKDQISTSHRLIVYFCIALLFLLFTISVQNFQSIRNQLTSSHLLLSSLFVSRLLSMDANTFTFHGIMFLYASSILAFIQYSSWHQCTKSNGEK